MATEEGGVQKSDLPMIIPASITIIPDLYYSGSGAVSVFSAGRPDQSVEASYSLSTSWRILGPLEVDLETSWNTGEMAYYWYRVEGECGSVTCDEFGLESRDCNRMTFVTTVSARNLPELCETLASPSLSAPVVIKASSIRRYSRPLFRDQIQPGQCNVLEDLEFCHIPECLDYCPTPPSALSVVEEETNDMPTAVETRGPHVAASSEFEDAILVSSGVSVSAAALGYEYDESAISYNMEPPSNIISACGCTDAGGAIVLRHNLTQSSRVSQFLSSGGLSLSSFLNLTHRPSESSWASTTHLRKPDGGWVVSADLSCHSEFWRFSLSVRESRKQTRLSFDLPYELVCAGGRPFAQIKCYFDQGSNVASYGKSVQVVSPARPGTYTASDKAEVFVGGIFVPYTVYYDEVGLFNDDFWEYSPLELYLNPISKTPTKTMSLSGIA